MSEVSFEEETPIARATPISQSKGSFITKIVISLGLAKDTDAAQIVLLIISCIGLIFSIAMFIIAFVPPHPAVPSSLLDKYNAKLEQGRQE